MNNKINVVIIGVLDTKESTNVSIAKSFMRFGFNVIPINYRTIISKYGMKFFEDNLIDTIRKYRPHLAFFCKTNGINPDIILECNKYTKTYHWFMDPVMTAKACPEVMQIAKNCNFSSCTGGEVSEYFTRLGVSNCNTIFDGLDYDLYKPKHAIIDYSADLGFIGSKSEKRDELLKILEREKIGAYFYGPGYSKYIDHDSFSEICSHSKFMLSVNNEQLKAYFSNRLLRYMGCGVCVLHYDPTGNLNEYFEDKKEILYFKSTEELINLIKSTPIQTAGKIALRGREKVLNNYTWDHTVGRILQNAGIIK